VSPDRLAQDRLPPRRPERASAGDDPIGLTTMLKFGVELVEDLGRKLQILDELMLTGRPDEIADAALVVEAALKSATPTLDDIATTMQTLGVGTLQAAAEQFRRSDLNDAAWLTESLRRALSRFAKRSVSAGRRAQTLNRGLNAALRSLQALGVQDSGRLIAEA
jgi:hypothetical protein